jgi:predicted ATPase
LRVAEDLLDDFVDGAWFVDLGALTDPGLVPAAVAQALGIREIAGIPIVDTLREYLRTRAALLILDNCEHLVDACARLADELLRTSPSIRVLATSREPLRGSGETTWRMPSLGLPPPAGVGSATLDDLMEFESVGLFVERARAAQPGFTLTPLNSSAVQEICCRLDGIPLALELAAARVRVFSVEHLAARLDDRFRLLTTGPRTAMPRQQTLQATVDWSYALLSEPERAGLRRLSVFAGGWTLEAAEMVIADDEVGPPAGLEVMASLVEKSLVVPEEHPGGMRYRLLETIRQYARERLEEAGEITHTRDRHLSFFLRLAETSEPNLSGPDARAVMDQLEAELDNLRAALEHALPEAALRLTGASGWFWWGRDYHTEGRRWCAKAIWRRRARSITKECRSSATSWGRGVWQCRSRPSRTWPPSSGNHRGQCVSGRRQHIFVKRTKHR